MQPSKYSPADARILLTYPCPCRKKRKRPSVEETDEFNRELCTLLESSSRILTAHMDSQNLNFHLDRTQRKEHAENLVAVLGKLADAIGKIADKL
ncbi:hypothetical protein KP509_1Z177400 [Ceratopteris richardii]|nr:hypothetical protein KP509_1Z177400 [Ceratopteris richardii]